MTRMSITLPVSLQNELITEARIEGKSLSEFVRDFMEIQLEKRAKAKRLLSYKAIESMIGVIKDGTTDTSQKIDEILYGENGAWRGDNANED